MKALEIWRARSLNPGKGGCLDGCVRKSRCCSRTSSGSSSWTDSDYEDRVVPVMSFSSQQPLRTFVKLTKLIPCRT